MRRRTGHPDFLDLPWDVPLARWRHERLVDVPRGISRHVVRFVRYADAIYALKELPRRLAEREYRLLAELDRLFIPVVEVAGLVTDRRAATIRSPDGELEAILITRHLDFSLPYRRVLGATGDDEALRDRLLDRWSISWFGCTSPGSSGVTAPCRTRSSAGTPEPSPLCRRHGDRRAPSPAQRWAAYPRRARRGGEHRGRADRRHRRGSRARDGRARGGGGSAPPIRRALVGAHERGRLRA